MEVFVDRISASVGITDVLDILIVAFLIYKVLGFIRETRAEQLAKGLLVLVVITMLSEVLHLYTLHWLLSGLMTVGLSSFSSRSCAGGSNIWGAAGFLTYSEK